MYSSPTLARKFIRYWFTASNGKGHGVHSPFVFDFINHVLNGHQLSKDASVIEAVRKELLKDKTVIDVEDFGAGSVVIPTRRRVVADIAASSLKRKKYARLLHRIAHYYHCQSIVELGTSLGITSAYLATSSPQSQLTTFEGATAIAAIANKTFEQLSLKNVKLVVGDFQLTLPNHLNGCSAPDLVFIDGNHRLQPTLDYFHQFRVCAHEHTIMIFDDIHWSAEMEQAWQEIKNDQSVTLTIDLFFIGLVFFKKDFKVKQHFTIRF